ncbi:MAG: 16S rRNA (cytosine(1402)-N(4))-methyltransferase RsmH [Bacteroidales bacterium]|nr:16S rRNA (cytosine(1402)-N(4))-methyltransferase RsmH [Bacteroidales bacterium]
MYHIPVLLEDSIKSLSIDPSGIYVDVTFGSGQHSGLILEKLANGRLIAFDRDQHAAQNVFIDDRFLFIRQNYRYLKNFLFLNGIKHINGLLADLGVSSHQIDQPERGFSTRFNGELDMRMDYEQELTASEIVNTYSEDRLTGILSQFGEVSNAGRLSAEICKARTTKTIGSTGELKDILLRHAPRGRENQYLAKVFQAFRIEVNEEIESLKEMLQQAAELLIPGGRIVVISYHSLEDRIVKNFFKTGNFEGNVVKDFYGNPIAALRPVTRKPIVPSVQEISDNPRSRSAKMRIAEKV